MHYTKLGIKYCLIPNYIILGRNTFRDNSVNSVNSVHSEIDNQNMPGFNLLQNNMNTAIARILINNLCIIMIRSLIQTELDWI